MTHAALNDAFSKLEKQRSELFEKLKAYDDKVLNQRPGENAWSVMEVLGHLAAVEEGSYKYLMKKTQDINAAQKVGIKETLKSFMLNTYLRVPIKYKAPAVVMPPGIYISLSDARASWDRIRNSIPEVWMKLPEDRLDRNWSKHVAAGKLSLMQMLTFIGTHFSRHEKQIWKTLKAVSK
jgi:hypothetical protein